MTDNLLGLVGAYADPSIIPFTRDRRVDLLASNVEKVANNRYVVYKHRVQPNQVEIVKAFIPYAMRRIDIGTATGAPQESFEYIPPEEGDGFFAFSMLRNGNPPIQMEINFNAPRPANAAALDNNERQVRSGITNLSVTPWRDALAGAGALPMAIPFESQAEQAFTFEILPASTITPLTTAGQFSIAVAAQKRVDFAGVFVVGVQMPQTLFNTLTGRRS